MTKLQNNCTKIINEHIKPRVAYIFNHSYFLGGGEISFFELIRKLERKEVESTAIVPKTGEIENKLALHNIEVHVNSFPTIKFIFNGSPLIALINFIKLARKKRLEMIHANGSRVCMYAGIAGKILGIPIIWHVRETIKDYCCYDGLLAFLATKIICVSNGVKKKRFKRFGFWAEKKIIVIYNGVDTKKFVKKNSDRKYVREKLGVDQNITLFGIIGNIIPIKGHDFFLRGLVRAKFKKPDLHLQLLIIGRKLDPSYFRKITKFILENNLNENVIIKNYSPNIREIFSAIDALALPSQREGLSRSMLEAMSCGLPVIATKISEVEEAIIDNKNGILVDYMDIEKMASAIIKLCNSKSMRNEIGTRNRLKVDRRFNLISHAKAIGSLYYKIIRNDSHNLCSKKIINFRRK